MLNENNETITPTNAESDIPSPEPSEVTPDDSVAEPKTPAAPPEPKPAEQELTEEQVEQKARELGVRPDLFDEGAYSAEEYEQMLSMYEDTLKNIEEGEIVKALILRVTENAAILDLGFKSEGSVPLDEFRSPEEAQPGAEVDVFLERLEDQEGVVVLSKKKADFLRVWEQIKESYDSDQPISGTIKKKVKGGVTVDIMGVDAFLPGSQVALRRVPNVDELIGQEFDFKILKLNKRRRNIVVSRRVILEQERSEKREELKGELEQGQVRTGVVKNITDFGAFIDLGGMDGLLHITDMSWGRVGRPGEICNIGDEIDVKILDIDWERERISLGLKQLQPYPWKDVEEKYPVGSRVRGKVVSITNYGAFVELERGVEGLVHISEMSWTRNVRHPSQLVSIGDEIEAVVLRVDPEEEKISLGIKQAEEDPWLALPEKYPPGTRIRGKVRNLTSFGAFVEVEPGIDGLVHVSDMSWTKRIQHPSEVLKKGDEVEVVALSIDVDQKRISLGLKQTEDDPWYTLAQKYAPGTETKGTAVRLLDKGVVVDLGDDVEGFVPVSQLAEDQEVRNPSDVVRTGDELEMKVMESDPINRRIVLQVTALPERSEEEAETSPAEADAAATDEPEAEAGAEQVTGEHESETKAEAESEAESEAETEAEAESEAETMAEAVTEAEAAPEAETATVAELETETDAETAPQQETADSAVEPEATAEESEEPGEERSEEEKQD
ncbi:MAG: 30S ribosomal protein S1 [Gemmatimonadales bacterium]|jgi:small subunit ribosomal protein S1